MPKFLFLADVSGPDFAHVGDEAMLEANIALFRRLFPDCSIDVAAGRDWDGSRLGVNALRRLEFSPESETDREACLRNLAETPDTANPVVAAALSCDALIISGGGNICGTWPHHIYERYSMARLAASRGAPVFILGQSLGPRFKERERELVAALLRLSSWTGLRERDSYSLALELGADPGTLSYQLDDAAFLTPEGGSKAGTVPENRPWIALTVHPLGESSVSNPVIARLVFQLRVVARETGTDLVFLPHASFPQDPNSPPGDADFGEAIGRAFYSNPPLRIHPLLTASGTMSLTQRASLVISTRYHPLVFALAGAVPAIGLWSDEYTRQKIRGVFVHAGRPADAMSLEEALNGGLARKALELWQCRETLKAELQNRVAIWRRDEEARGARLHARLSSLLKLRENK